MEVLDALERYEVQLVADGRSEHTIGQYRRHVALLAGWMGREGLGGGLEAVEHEVLARFLASSDARTSRLGGRKRETSMNALRTSLRTFFGYCHAAGWLAENPARLVRLARCAGPAPRGLSDPDRARLLAVLDGADSPEARRDQVLFELLLGTGMRLSAALSLRVEDLDLERGEALVRRAKGNRVERVVLGSAIRQRLGAYIGERRVGVLFTSRVSRSVSRRHAARRLRTWMRRAGCTSMASPHSLRHDFAQRLYLRTRDVLLVQAALGHRSVESTAVYARADLAAVRAAVNAV